MAPGEDKGEGRMFAGLRDKLKGMTGGINILKIQPRNQTEHELTHVLWSI